MTSPVVTSSVTQWVPARELGARRSEAMHEKWDEKRADDHAAASAVLNKLPVKPLSRARENPTQGSRSYLHLMARAVVNKGGAPSLLAPVTSTASWVAGTLAPAISVGTSGIGSMAASLSGAMAKGVNATTEAMYEKSSQFVNAVYSSAGSKADTDVKASRRGSNERKNACRFMQPMLRAA